MYLSYGSYTCFTKHILVLRILYRVYSGTKVPIGTTQIPYTEVPVGTTGLILILPIGVLIGTTKLVLILPIREYPWVLLDLYLFDQYGSTCRYY